MIKKYIILLILFIQSVLLFATEQIPDILIYNGGGYPITVNPMEGYFNEFPEKRPQIHNSMLWRGYAAKFEIIQNELWVIDISSIETNIIDRNLVLSPTSIINECLDGRNRMKIEWYSGALVFRHGEQYILLNIQNGNIISETNMDFKQFIRFKEKQYEYYRKTEEYRNLKEKYKSDILTDEQIDFIIMMVVIETLDIMIYE
jgi:hypothetical protein